MDKHYLDIEGIKKAFGEYLKNTREYSDSEVEIAVSDFPDPYNNPYLIEEYLSDETINDKVYESYTYYVDFEICGFPASEEGTFAFYTYYKNVDINDHKVGSYRKANKLYSIDIDTNDFHPDIKIYRHIKQDETASRFTCHE